MTIFNSDKKQNEKKDTLGSRISQKRKEAGLTQEEFSQILGVTAQAVSKWENDASCPDIMLLPKISEALSVSIDELMGVKQTEKISDENVKVIKEEEINFHNTADIARLKLRLIITDPKKTKPTTISLPLPFVIRLADMGVKISGVLGTSAISDSQLKQILELVKSGVVGEIFDLTTDEGIKINIEIS